MTLETLPLDAVLCYVCGGTAYFTTQPLEKQWGDDWNDAPYEHNAGEPYWPHDSDKANGVDWQIATVRFEGPFDEPSEGRMNSPWSVQDINRHCVAWLAPSRYGARHMVSIYAGTTLADFVKKVQKAGGTVFWPLASAKMKEQGA